MLEVKDFIAVERPDAKGAWVKRNSISEPEWEKSPVEQGRKAAELINNKLIEDPCLRNYSGKLDFSYRYAGVLPKLPLNTISWLARHWGAGKVLGYADLDKEVLLKKITTIPAPFTIRLTDRQFDAVRAVLDTANSVQNIQTGAFKGIYSQTQEEIAKSAFVPPRESTAENENSKQEQIWGDVSLDLKERLSHLEGDVPDEVLELQKARNIKLVRGFSGTGKTDVLVMRARYLNDLYPELEMLVTTFNKPLVEERLIPEFKKCSERIHTCTFDSLCMSIYKDRIGSWPTIQDVGSVIKNLEGNEGQISELIKKYGDTFIEQEFIWMKDAGLINQETYLSTHRTGRSKMSGRVLHKSAKEEIFEVFTAYQSRLQNDLRAYDWPDMHQKVWEFIQTGSKPKKMYDIIFVDEAQHFAPLWFEILMAHLKPNGSIFLCEDPSQSVYRFYSWKQKKIPVSGKTRWLHVPYRTTREIFLAAYSLVKSNPLAKNLMGEDRNIPDLDDENIRTGERPQVYHFDSYEREKEFVQNEIEKLVRIVLPSEIAILHTEKYIHDAYKKLVPDAVKVDEIKRRTGMEYKIVFIPQVHRLFSGDKVDFDYERAETEHQLALYTAMTRARDKVYLLFGQKWPKEFDVITSYVDWPEG